MRDLPLPTLPFARLPDLRPSAAARRSLPASDERTSPARLDVIWACSDDDVLEAQALRYRVFVGEMGARLNLPEGAPAAHDIDRFDPFCEHLLVRTVDAQGQPGKAIGTYRVLTPAAAKRAGGLYSETEFDLTRLRSLRGNMVEVGRSCVHPDHRSGGAIMALWGALAEFMLRNDLDTMIGCASVSMCDGGHFAASLWKQLEKTHLADIEWQVRPRLPLPIERLKHDLAVEAPPLIKGYLRCGARVLGAPAWDPDFNTADLPLMMRLADLPPRYRRHFMT